MFVDRTKRTMATVEARTDVPAAYYAERQRAFDAELLTAPGRRWDSASASATEHRPDADGPDAVADRSLGDRHGRRVESAAGKAIGVRRALRPAAAPTARSPAPGRRSATRVPTTPWPTSCTRLGYAVTHVDVGPQPPLERPYPVLTVPGLTDDAAGAAHLHELVARFG